MIKVTIIENIILDEMNYAIKDNKQIAYFGSTKEELIPGYYVAFGYGLNTLTHSIDCGPHAIAAYKYSTQQMIVVDFDCCPILHAYYLNEWVKSTNDPKSSNFSIPTDIKEFVLNLGMKIIDAQRELASFFYKQ